MRCFRDIGESSSACLHGVITRVSPIKDSTRNPKLKYFNANMTNGKKSVRLVSFDTTLLGAMQASRKVPAESKVFRRDALQMIATSEFQLEMTSLHLVN